MSIELGARVLPPIRRPGARAHRLLERNLVVYRRIWIILFSGFFEPVFYLLSIGIGVGFLVNQGITLADGRVVTYTAFVAPALLASSAMNGAIYESTLNVFFRLKWNKVYDGILATPLQPLDIALGEIGWSQIRGCIYAIGFTIVMALFGLVTSLWGILAVPIALLIGFAFAGVGMAATTFMKGWQDFDLIQLVIQPLFLFSGTFFPVSQYPEWLQAAVQISPLYHGTELLRAAMLNAFDWSIVGHIAFLATMGTIGLLITRRRFEKLLMP
jgi:lipooligosaccharide transport system permease protein